MTDSFCIMSNSQEKAVRKLIRKMRIIHNDDLCLMSRGEIEKVIDERYKFIRFDEGNYCLVPNEKYEDFLKYAKFI